MNQDLHLDFETYSGLDIRKVGAFRYARHDSTEVLICCYWLPDMDPDTDSPMEWLPLTEPVPADLLAAAKNKKIRFWAHNAQFEYAVWNYALRRQHSKLPRIPEERWRCTAVLAASCGLARSLDGALKMLGGAAQKDPEGERLIKLFCKPRKPTKADKRTRIHPWDNAVEFRKFVSYCSKDVTGELYLHNMLPPMEPREEDFYVLDLKMNVRGLPVDLPLVQKALSVLSVLESDIAQRVQAITGGVRASQAAKLKEWFATNGLDLENLQKQTILDVLQSLPEDTDQGVRDLLALRIEAGKASTKKLVSMSVCADPDDWVVQGGFLMNGAHTGRYAGRLIQPQNFIRGTLKPFQQDLVFALLELADPEMFKLLYAWPIDTISQCMRGFLKAPHGTRWVVVDYTAIEARVLAWCANEERVLEAYFNGQDVYKIMASRLFGVPIEEVTAEQRRLGKNLVLGCGYSLGGDRFVEYCAGLGQHVEPKFAKKAVKMYRDDHPAIVRSWKSVETAVAQAIRNPGQVFTEFKCRFYVKKQWLNIELPSGRCIRYFKPRAVPVERYGKPAYQISFLTDYHGKVIRETTYGGKLVENIVQGIARDVMREGMFNAEDNGYPVHGTVHDELLTLPPVGQGSVHELEKLVCDLPRWTKGIPLGSEGFETDRYRKG
jgi:DNA polymerase